MGQLERVLDVANRPSQPTVEPNLASLLTVLEKSLRSQQDPVSNTELKKLLTGLIKHLIGVAEGLSGQVTASGKPIEQLTKDLASNAEQLRRTVANVEENLTKSGQSGVESVLGRLETAVTDISNAVAAIPATDLSVVSEALQVLLDRPMPEPVVIETKPEPGSVIEEWEFTLNRNLGSRELESVTAVRKA